MSSFVTLNESLTLLDVHFSTCRLGLWTRWVPPDGGFLTPQCLAPPLPSPPPCSLGVGCQHYCPERSFLRCASCYLSCLLRIKFEGTFLRPYVYTHSFCLCESHWARYFQRLFLSEMCLSLHEPVWHSWFALGQGLCSFWKWAQPLALGKILQMGQRHPKVEVCWLQRPLALVSTSDGSVLLLAGQCRSVYSIFFKAEYLRGRFLGQ